jgi:hypothetical protein
MQNAEVIMRLIIDEKGNLPLNFTKTLTKPVKSLEFEIIDPEKVNH